MRAVAGIGWIARGRFGAQRRGTSGSFAEVPALRDELLARGILAFPPKRFAKLDDDSRMATLVAALTLHDAGVECAEDRARDVGVLATSEAGCLQTNRKFYEDFVEHGRKRGRGSLFVYTLASMPAAEVSMHFKLTGPTAWIRSEESAGRHLLERAGAMLRRREAEALLALDVSELGGVGFHLRRADRGEALADLATALAWVERHPTLDRMVGALLSSDGISLAPLPGTG